MKELVDNLDYYEGRANYLSTREKICDIIELLMTERCDKCDIALVLNAYCTV